jgi:HlyD family secretion protein
MTQIRGLRPWSTILLLPFILACATGEAEEAPTLQRAVVTRGDLMITAEATGLVEPIREVEVKSKASGEILRLHVDIGDEVAPGALLAEIDPRDVRNASDQAEADLQVARARLEISQAQLGRSELLLASGVISLQEHESKNLDFANSQATLVKAETNYELSQLRLSDVIIRAPMAGTILQKDVEEGQVIQSASQNVSGGTTLLIMADLRMMQVRTLVDETDMGEIRKGMEAIVDVEAFPNRSFVGTVDKIEPQAVVQQNVTMFPVIVTLDNDLGLLKPGMNGEVQIEIAQAPGVLLIPNNAVVNPQDVQPAAMALGLDPDALGMGGLFAGGRGRGRGGPSTRGQGGARPGGAQAGAGQPGRGQGRGVPDGGAAATSPNGGPGRSALDSLRARVDRGEISQDSVRVLMRQLRGGPEGRGFRPQQAGEGARGLAMQRDTRRAVVFVFGEDGVPTPRPIMIGLNDWDFTEVVSGLEGGEELAVIGAAQLRATQDAFLERIRSRSSTPFGGGGPGGGGGRGGR